MDNEIHLLPNWYVYSQRIYDLNEAINESIIKIKNSASTESHIEDYKLISQWAREITALAELEANIEFNKNK